MNSKNLNPEEIELVLKHRASQVNLDNINSNSALAEYCAERGIDMKTIVSVKHWQNMSGEPRFSIVTKDETVTSDVLFEQVHSFISEHAPHYKKHKYKIKVMPHNNEPGFIRNLQVFNDKINEFMM